MNARLTPGSKNRILSMFMNRNKNLYPNYITTEDGHVKELRKYGLPDNFYPGKYEPINSAILAVM